MTHLVLYSRRFDEAVASVLRGGKGQLSDSRFLIDNYGQGCYDIIVKGLEHPDERVRTETILLFSRLRIRKPAEIIDRMAMSDRDMVAGACVAYFKGFESDDEKIPELLYTVNHRDGAEFRTAMRTLGSIASEKDLPEIRRVYGQVTGEMKEETRLALLKIIDRDSDLESKRILIMSEPVFPDGDAYRAFMERSVEYLDVRYRKNVEPRTSVKLTTYNQVVAAILKIQTRIYNERDNLGYYDDGIREENDRLTELLIWAAEDLKTKRIVRPEE